MCNGRSVFMGYLKDESGTLKAFDKEMWFHTQDLGSMTEDGFLKIYGRIQGFNYNYNINNYRY